MIPRPSSQEAGDTLSSACQIPIQIFPIRVGRGAMEGAILGVCHIAFISNAAALVRPAG